MEFVTVDDIGKALGRPITSQAERDQVELWIEEAVGLIEDELGDLNRLVAAKKIRSETARIVIRRAVVRKARNPGGKKDERIDDYSYGLAADMAQSDVYITDHEWRMLRPKEVTGAFTIRTAGSPGFAPRPWGC